MFEARHLRVFRAVATTGSFSAAARELGITQPAVSQQIRALEGAAHTPLLTRDGRTLRLTEAGEVLARHADGVLAALGAAEAEVSAIAGLRAGQVRLVSFPSGSSTLVPAALAALRARHPALRVSLSEAEPPRSEELVRAGACDVALAFRYPDARGEEPWEGLEVRRLRSDLLVGVLPASHRHAGAAELPLRDLADEPWIAGCPRCREQLERVCAGEGFTPRVDLATDDYPAVVALVGAGLGVAVLPQLALEPVRPRGVRVVPVTPPTRREIVALTLPGLAGVPAVAALLDALAECGGPAVPTGAAEEVPADGPPTERS